MCAQIVAVDYQLGRNCVTNSQLAGLSDQWTEEKIWQKTGVKERRIAGDDEYASDLACGAAERLFARAVCRPVDVDFLVYVTQSPDQFMPATACILQARLGLPSHCGAIDINQGCSGYVYGLGVVSGLIDSGQARGALLLCGDTVSRYLAPNDLSVRTLFGDAGSATWIQASDPAQHAIGPFLHGTDGTGAGNLCVRGGGLRHPTGQENEPPQMFMDGPEVFAFTMSAVPSAVRALLERAQLTADDIDLFVFHQANGFILEHLRSKLKIPKERFVVAMDQCGNTTSSSIPIALRIAEDDGRLCAGMRVMVVGFGVGYSWSLSILKWGKTSSSPPPMVLGNA